MIAPADIADVAKPVVRWSLGHRLPKTMLYRAARRGDLQGRLVAADPSADLNPLWNELRDAGPLYRGKFAWVTARMPVVREVLSSSDFRTGFEPGDLPGLGRLFGWAAHTGHVGPLEPPSLLVTEPPDHTRYRKLVTRVFSVRAVEQLRVRTEQIAADLLDGFAGESEVDIVERYCTLLPVTVITEILGVPPEERDRVLAFGAAAAPSLDIGLSWRQFRTTETALARFDRWLGGHIARLRESPGEDLFSQLVATELTEAELKATAGLVLAAGFETTVNLLGNGVALLDEHRGQLALLQSDPELWPNAIEEILRFDPPVLLTGRTAMRDTTVAGVPVARGELVTTLLAAANRDPDVFESPDVFDVARPDAREHVSFSAGRHYCLGAALARMEGEVGLRALYSRYPALARSGAGERRETRILRGYRHLPVSLG